MYANPVSHAGPLWTADELICVTAADLEHDDERTALAMVQLDDLAARGLITPRHTSSQTPYDDGHRLQLLAIARRLADGASLETLERRHKAIVAAARACAEADPDALSRAAAAGLADGRIEFAIFDAMAYSMRGDWRRALTTLDTITVEDLPKPAASTSHWQFGYHHARFEALLRVDVSRATQGLEQHLVPLATSEGSRVALQTLECCRAELGYHLGDATCRLALQRLPGHREIGRFAAAEIQFMLGDLALHARDVATARECLTRSVRLAPRTWVRAAAIQLTSAARERARPRGV